VLFRSLAGRAAATIFARVCALVPRAHEGLSAEQILRLSDEKLRAAGLSRSKLLSLRDLAQKAVSGEIPTLAQVQNMEDDAIVESLTHVRGIGRWTVEMLLIFRLGRPDVLPVDDYGVRKGFGVAMRKREMPSRFGSAKARRTLASVPQCGELVFVESGGPRQEIVRPISARNS